MKSLYNFLNRSLHEVLGFAPTILLTVFFFRVNIFLLKGELLAEIIPHFIMELQ